MNIIETAPINQGFWTYAGAEVKIMMVCENPCPVFVANRFCSPDFAHGFWERNVARAKWYDPEKEMCVVLCLDRKNNIKAWNLVSIGTATSSLIHPREVFRPVIAAAATACVLMHNHPSGDPTPSEADERCTVGLRQAAAVLDIEFVDHIVVGTRAQDPRREGFYSIVGAMERARKHAEEKMMAEWAARREARKQDRLARKRAKEAAAA